MLANKVALISGTGGGQGRAAALHFAEEGAIVVGCDVNAEANRETVKLVEAAGGIMTGPLDALDLSTSKGAQAWIDSAIADHGRIDVLYNNASSPRLAPVDKLSDEDWYFTLRNELDIVFFPTRAAWPHLAVRGGVIINIGSTSGWSGKPNSGIVAHAATKGGVIAMTRQLAAEGAPLGIRAVSISPGLIMTPGTAEYFQKYPEIREKLVANIPLGRPGEPKEIVAMAAFVASDKASFLTATDIVIDGGMLGA